MEPKDREVITLTLDVLERLMRLFRMERILHMAGRTFSGIDLSARFRNTNVAAGTYEIWLAPGAIAPNAP